MMRHDPNVHHDPCKVKPLCERMRSAGIEVFDTNIEYGKEPRTHDSRLRSVARQIRQTLDLDAMHVDHRKLVVIDGAIAYRGGANIGAQYLYRQAFDASKEARAEGDELKAAGNPEPWCASCSEGPALKALPPRTVMPAPCRRSAAPRAGREGSATDRCRAPATGARRRS